MKNFERNEMIKIGREKYVISDITKILAKLPSEIILEFFKGKKQFIDKTLLIEVLRCILKDSVYDYRIKHKKSSQELACRLNYYKNFSLTQLVNLLITLDYRRKLSLHLYNDIWYLFLGILDEVNITSNDLKNLYKLAETYKGTNQESVKEYMSNVLQLFYDKKGYFDGVLIEDLKENLIQSSTITEVREIASIYGISIPKRIKKNELIDLILKELKSRNEDITGVEEKLKNTSIVLIQRYCKDNKINASVELKKKEVIDYLFKSINFNKELSEKVITFNFEMPQRSDISDDEFYSIKTEYDPNVINEDEIMEEFEEDNNITENNTIDNKILEKIVERLDSLYELVLAQQIKNEVKEEKQRKKGFFRRLIKFIVILLLLVFILTGIFYFVFEFYIDKTILPEFLLRNHERLDNIFGNLVELFKK